MQLANGLRRLAAADPYPLPPGAEESSLFGDRFPAIALMAKALPVVCIPKQSLITFVRDLVVRAGRQHQTLPVYASRISDTQRMSPQPGPACLLPCAAVETFRCAGSSLLS